MGWFEEAEDVASRILHNPYVFLWLELGKRGAEGDRPLDARRQVVHGNVEVHHHLLCASLGRPDGRDVVWLRLERQAGSSTRRLHLRPVRLIRDQVPSEELRVEARKRLRILRPQYRGGDSHRWFHNHDTAYSAARC